MHNYKYLCKMHMQIYLKKDGNCLPAILHNSKVTYLGTCSRPALCTDSKVAELSAILDTLDHGLLSSYKFSKML